MLLEPVAHQFAFYSRNKICLNQTLTRYAGRSDSFRFNCSHLFKKNRIDSFRKEGQAMKSLIKQIRNWLADICNTEIVVIFIWDCSISSIVLETDWLRFYWKNKAILKAENASNKETYYAVLCYLPRVFDRHFSDQKL